MSPTLSTLARRALAGLLAVSSFAHGAEGMLPHTPVVLTPASAPEAQPALLPQPVFTKVRAEALQAALESYKSLALHTVVQVGFINENRPTEKPVVVMVNSITNDRPAIKAFGRDVLYLTREQIQQQQLINFIEIKRISVLSASSADVGFIYPYRDISGQLLLTKTEHGWEVNRDQVVLGIANAQYYMILLYQGLTCRDDTEYAGWKNRVAGFTDDKCRDEHGQLLHPAANAAK